MQNLNAKLTALFNTNSKIDAAWRIIDVYQNSGNMRDLIGDGDDDRLVQTFGEDWSDQLEDDGDIWEQFDNADVIEACVLVKQMMQFGNDDIDEVCDELVNVCNTYYKLHNIVKHIS